MAPLDAPRAFSTPIMVVRSRMMISKAEVMLMMATITISTITTITLVSSRSSQAKISGKRSRTLRVRSSIGSSRYTRSSISSRSSKSSRATSKPPAYRVWLPPLPPRSTAMLSYISSPPPRLWTGVNRGFSPRSSTQDVSGRVLSASCTTRVMRRLVSGGSSTR